MIPSLNLTPYQRFQVIFEKWIRYTSIAAGLNILDNNFTFSVRSLFSFCVALSVVVTSAYTMFAFDMDMFFKATVFFSLGSQYCSKFYTIAASRSEIMFLYSFNEKIYVVNEKKPPKKIRLIMDECSSYKMYTTAALYTLYILCAIIFLLYPMLVFAIFRIEEPWLPMFIPGIPDYNTTEGFVITSIYHYVVIFLSGVGFGFVDALFFNLVFEVFTMSKLQCNQLSMVNEEVAKAKPCQSAIRTRMTNLFLMNLEVEKYIDLVNDAYFWMIFVQVVSITFSTTFLVYVIMTMTWYPAYFLATCAVFQMFIFCALGTVVQVANEQLEHANLQANFYLLPLDLQRDYMFMINVGQHAKRLKTAKIELDVALFLSIIRKIYSSCSFEP